MSEIRRSPRSSSPTCSPRRARRTRTLRCSHGPSPVALIEFPADDADRAGDSGPACSASICGIVGPTRARAGRPPAPARPSVCTPEAGDRATRSRCRTSRWLTSPVRSRRCRRSGVRRPPRRAVGDLQGLRGQPLRPCRGGETDSVNHRSKGRFAARFAGRERPRVSSHIDDEQVLDSWPRHHPERRSEWSAF